MRTGKEITIGADGTVVEVLKEFDETLIPQSEPTPIEPTLEERVDRIEPTLVTVVETLAEIVGVV